ncbi:MAG: TIGR03016 family PEP-CTERM system-associated outer membrane protein [Rhodocyclaceae bacterium]
MTWAVWLACAAASPQAGAEWHSEATLRVGETFTDNVDLAPDGLKRSDWVTEITPGLRIYGKGARTEADVWASVQNQLHADSQSGNDVNMQLNARGKMEVWDKHVFVDAAAGMTQQSTSLFGAQNNNSYNTDTNRSNVRTGSISPYGIWHFGGEAVAQLRYRYEYSDSDNSALSNQSTQSYDASVSNGSAWGRAGWGLSVNGQHNSGDTNTRSYDSDSYRGWLSYGVLHDLRLQVFGGQERNDYTSGDSITTNNYGVGLDWTPTQRTQVSGDISHRFFGTGYHFKVSERWRLVALEFGGARDVTNSSSVQDASGVSLSPDFLALDSALRGAIPNASDRYTEVLRQLAARGISPFDLIRLSQLNNQYSLEKRFYGSLAARGSRNTVTFTLSRSDRRRLLETGFENMGGDLSFFEHTIEDNANLSWSTRITPLATVLASVNYSQAKGEGGGSGDETAQRRTTSGTLTLDRKLGPNSNGSLTYRYTRQTGSSPYTENAVAATLWHRF